MSNGWKNLKTKELQQFLSDLAGDTDVYVPYKIDDRWQFQKYDAAKDLTFPPNIIDVSVKSLFFPKRRPIAKYHEGEQWDLTPVGLPDRPRVIMGVRACDIAGLLYVDRVFLDGPHKDALYEAERKRTTLIGMVCDDMGPHCHCTDRGLAPDNTEGMDMIFVSAKDGYLFRALTDKGKILLTIPLFKDTDEKPAKRTWPRDRYPIASPDEFMTMYNDTIWHELSDICLTCGACTYECPTCVCFLVSDERYQGKGERVTVWDSCQLTSYARMAGGHNTRKTPASRVRNRTLDKFSYSHKRYGRISCTGCGRCVIVCPIKRSFPDVAAVLTEKIRKHGRKEKTRTKV
jgi:sulfhydrogenase subunit beta (sulfur reductase)